MNIEAFHKVIPPVTETNRPFWEGCKLGELRLQTCNDCGMLWFPEGPCCPDCLSSKIAWKAVSGRGKVWSYIIMHQKYMAAFADEVPYLVAMIHLEEGPRMYSTVVNAPVDLACDTPVEVIFESIGDRTIPKFKLVGS
jgi:uncharacterized OB-fold protein